MRGFSVLELLVATTLLLLALLLAGGAMLESQRLLVRQATAFENGPASFAVAQLRSDLQSARGVGNASLLWSPGALELIGSDGGRVLFLPGDGGLRRVVVDPADIVVGERILLRDLTAWRWRSPHPRLVDIVLTTPGRTPPRGTSLLLRFGEVESEQRRDVLRVALRGAGGTAW